MKQSLEDFKKEVEKAGSKVLDLVEGYYQVSPLVKMQVVNEDTSTEIHYVHGYFQNHTHDPVHTLRKAFAFAHAVRPPKPKYINPVQLVGAVVEWHDRKPTAVLTITGDDFVVVFSADNKIISYHKVSYLASKAKGWRCPGETELRSFVEGE